MSFTDGIDAYCCAFEAYMNKDTIQDLREEINKMTALVNGFRSENDRFKEENAKLYLSNEELKRKNKQLEKININLDNEISELKEEIERRGYTILSAENKCLKEINLNLKVEIEKLKDQCVFCERQKDQVQKERDALLKLSNTMTNENLKLGEEVKQLKEENRQFKLSKNCLCDANKRLDEANGFLRRDIIELQNQCCKWNKDYEALTKETAFFEEEIKRLKEENKRLKERSLIDRYNQVTAKNRELKNQELKFEEEIKKLKEENKDLYERLKDIEIDWMEAECATTRVEEAFDKVSKQNVELINKLTSKAETKIYQLSAEDFAKTFKGQWTISIEPDGVSTTNFTVNNENDKDRLSYYLTYKDDKYNEPFDKIYKYLKNYQIERVVIAKLLDEIKRKYTNLEFDNIWLESKVQKIEKEPDDKKRYYF